MEVTLHYLEDELKPRLKNPETREEAFNELMQISPDRLDVQTLFYLSHLKSRYYTYMYKAYEDIEDLRLAIDYCEEVFHIGREYNTFPKKPIYHFPRVYLKFLLMELTEDPVLQNKQRERVAYYVDKKLCAFPGNPSFLWLKNQL
ncbi:MAG: hypothetical protein RLP14_08255 [Owenweeksia sp.]